jgi:hypothetical protein
MAPRISGRTWVCHSKKFSRVSFSEMLMLSAATPLVEPEEEDAPNDMVLRTGGASVFGRGGDRSTYVIWKSETLIPYQCMGLCVTLT